MFAATGRAMSGQVSTFCRRSFLAGLASLGMARGAAAAADPAISVLVIGDSQAQGLAGGLLRMYRRDRRAKVMDRSKISTGLSSTTAYDWPAAVKTFVGQHEDVSLALFGANDRPPFRAASPANQDRLEAWKETYSERVRDIMVTLLDDKSRVVWVGHPIVRDPAWNDDIRLLNSIFEDAAADTGATWAPLYDAFAPNREYAPYGPGADGVVTRLRADDGVHLTPAGYDLAASILRPLIEGT